MLRDNYHRQINYLRLSITDMCNLHCIYCQSWKEVDKKRQRDILSYEEIIRLTLLLVRLGVSRVRLTGGEPLVRQNIIYLIKELIKIKGLEEISLTTNAAKLAKLAVGLKEAGIRRINVSLDSLDKERYARITGGGNLSDVLAGIEEALRVGLGPLKINMVVMKGINDDEVEKFANLTLDKPIQVRFIELIPIGQQKDFWVRRFLSTNLIRKRLADNFNLILSDGLPGNGPAKYYQITGAVGKIGFISPISDHFCERCNRIRLTPDGHLRLCLGQNIEVNLKQVLRQGASDEELERIIVQAMSDKPAAHQFQLKSPTGRQMSAIGG
ncbi:GTP 3',8-cyclase MoaA [bacterium]|nr:GTP 3',8-cyclase MoaA [bacterium]MBU1152595.1 GTP 3',8-cyclase MoaA [bacterium]MBU1782202.1 GTP 3',8-cyclase MoaA [bacterium]MBU2600287.1 GTP 3',8-cyclase MoaA [bacterium]